MKTEKIILSFIAALIGLLVAGVAFYLFQNTKLISRPKDKLAVKQFPTPTPSTSIFLTIDQPENEDVFETKKISLSGKTAKNSTVIVSTALDDQIVTPSSNGSFSTTVSIESGENRIEIIAIAPNGESTKTTKVVTFSTEKF